MGVLGKSKYSALKVFLIGITILLGTITITVDVSDTTTVSIDPSSQTVSSGDTFTVNVSCVPDQPIKSFEFKVSFDASLFQANSRKFVTISFTAKRNTSISVLDLYDVGVTDE